MHKLTNATGKYERGKDQVKNTLLLCVDSSFNFNLFDTLFVEISTGFRKRRKPLTR